MNVSDIMDYFSKMYIIEMHLLWIALFDVLLFIGARASNINFKPLVILYTGLHLVMIIVNFSTLPYSTPVSNEFFSEIYIRDFPIYLVYEVLGYLAIFPVIKFFKK